MVLEGGKNNVEEADPIYFAHHVSGIAFQLRSIWGMAEIAGERS